MTTSDRPRERVLPDDLRSHNSFDVRSPAHGQVLKTLPAHSAADVAAMAEQLRSAQPEWEALGPNGRAVHLRNWLDWILDNENRLLEIVQAESGKSWGDTKIETMVAVEVINYYTKHAATFLADRSLRPHGVGSANKRLRLHIRPYALVGQIFPWNYPLAMPMLDVPPALMAGAAVLTKPSESTPLAWAEVVRGFREDIGAPPVLDCATGMGATGAAVVEHADMVMFTGSTRTGRSVGVRAAERLVPCSLELGGKDPLIVLSDADLDRAARGAVWGGLFNAGQSCIAVERIYVEEPVYEEFLAKLVERVEELRHGTDAPGTFQTDVGALASEAQLRIVEHQVQDAVSKGARILIGGKRATQGCYYLPTILVDVDHTMQIMREETFGPTLPVMRVADEAEAVRLANDSEYGLGASVFTRDAARAERVARALEVGSVSTNNPMMGVFQFPLPFGGWKQSGIGSRFGGADGILKFCRRQGFTTERVALPTEAHWYPHSARKSAAVDRLIRLLGAHDWRRRVRRPT